MFVIVEVLSIKGGNYYLCFNKQMFTNTNLNDIIWIMLLNGGIFVLDYENKVYVAIDLKSFYASVECRERNLNPLTTNLVVADNSRK